MSTITNKTPIESSLELETIDIDLYRSRELWKPIGILLSVMQVHVVYLVDRYLHRLWGRLRDQLMRSFTFIHCIPTFCSPETALFLFSTKSSVYAREDHSVRVPSVPGKKERTSLS